MLCEIAPDQALLRCHDWSRDDRARLSAHTAFVRTPKIAGTMRGTVEYDQMVESLPIAEDRE